MFNDLIINDSLDIIKFLNKLNLDLFFSKPQFRHLIAFLLAMVLKGFNGKISDVNEFYTEKHRTTISRFINKSSWDESLLLEEMKAYAIKLIWQRSIDTSQPIYIIIDDTVNEKTVPSSKAQRKIQGCSFHNSHLKRKTVYGHQFVTVMLRCEKLVLPYDIILYQKDEMSKIELAQKALKEFPKPANNGYVLADSWYSCEAVFNASQSIGFQYIGALKSNRKIFPRGYKKDGIKISDFIKTLKQHELDVVTVGGKTYYTYTYLGKINGFKRVKIIMSWPQKALWNKYALKCFISLDVKLSTKQILNHYLKRWPIETFFRETKQKLGFDKYQIHTLKGIKRYMYLLMLTYLYCELEVEGKSLGFTKGLKKCRNEVKKLEITSIYNQAKQGISLENVLKSRKIAQGYF